VSYLSLYRKYRSQTFDDLVGQGHVVRTLQNGISSGRIAHAYLFTGPRGTGKTSTARLLAKALCCESGPTPHPDNTCEICHSITTGNCVDVIEMDAASEAGVEDIREKIVEVVEYQPMIARYKVFIIDEVHDLSAKAFDALLKTIEEPPSHIIFILATTEYNKVPATIRSRCQKHEFHRASMADLMGRLQHVIAGEGLDAEPAAVSAIARMADGGYRDALTLLEQAILTAEDNKVTLQQIYDQLGLINDEVVDSLLLAIKGEDIPKIIDTLGEVFRLGRDPRAVIESLLYRLADLTRVAYGVDSGADVTQEAAMHETAAKIGRERLLMLRTSLSEAHKVIRDITLPRIWLESELVRVAQNKQAAAAEAPARVAAKEAGVAEVKGSAPAQSLSGQEKAEKLAPQRVDSPAAKPATDNNGQSAVQHITPADVGSSVQELNDRWHVLLGELPPQTAHAKKLVESKVIDVKDKYLRVEVTHNLFLSWFEENPARKTFVQGFVEKVFGPGWQALYVAPGKRAASVHEVAAVELPAEGARLEQLAREILAPDPSREEV